ncbi:MAG: hypothetical protein PHI12_08135 [Dehalococcoidales bacterium]|jgi:hypothetical protein|nr:hypothetical protein [Dehalococcoidales bacterium]
MADSPTKEEISSMLNKFFKTSIDWTKLTRDEMVELATVLAHPEILYESFGITKKDLERGKLIGQVGGAVKDTISDGIAHWDGPFMNLAKRALLGEPSTEQKKEGEK